MKKFQKREVDVKISIESGPDLGIQGGGVPNLGRGVWGSSPNGGTGGNAPVGGSRGAKPPGKIAILGNSNLKFSLSWL